jgi:hypothetical protein
LTRLQLGERYCLLNSLGEEDVILDRVSHYAEPNIKVSSNWNRVSHYFVSINLKVIRDWYTSPSSHYADPISNIKFIDI